VRAFSQPLLPCALARENLRSSPRGSQHFCGLHIALDFVSNCASLLATSKASLSNSGTATNVEGAIKRKT
jgi:hypothetical protein